MVTRAQNVSRSAMDALLTIIALVATVIAVDLAEIPWGSSAGRSLAEDIA